MQPDPPLTLSLTGVFRLATRDGHWVDIAGDLQKRLIAILARSPHLSRSREQLIDLLWDGSKDGHASLRQLRHHLQRRLEPFGAGLVATGNVVRLTGVREVAVAGRPGGAEFFEDAGFGTEAFEDWLRTERMAGPAPAAGQAAAPDPAARGQAQHRAARFVPHLGLCAPIVGGSDPRAAALGDRIATALRDAIVANDFALLSDLRQGGDRPSGVDCLIEVRVDKLGPGAEVSVAALSGAGLRCIASHRLALHDARTAAARNAGLDAFISTTAAGIERAIARSFRFDLMAWNEAPLYEIVTRMFRLQRAEVQAAAQALDRFDSEVNPASVLAWRAFGMMLLNGERLVERGSSAVEEAQALIAGALETDPLNPTALSVAAHFASYNRRDFVRAAELSDLALRVAPHSPFARDVRAMLELYCGRLDAADRQAQAAAALALNGPLRRYVEASVVMTAALSGRHARAIGLGRQILAARPGFLPVQRHMFASLAITGQVPEARAMLAAVRQADPAFGTGGMEAPDYAMPSRDSRLLVRRAMAAIGGTSERRTRWAPTSARP